MVLLYSDGSVQAHTPVRLDVVRGTSVLCLYRTFEFSFSLYFFLASLRPLKLRQGQNVLACKQQASNIILRSRHVLGIDMLERGTAPAAVSARRQ